MEDNKKSSFYDFLLANSELNRQETKPTIKKQYIALSWLIVFLANAFILFLGWNYAMTPILKLPSISFVQSLLLYAVSKVLTRGFFSVQ
jgi:hypothetical protein